MHRPGLVALFGLLLGVNAFAQSGTDELRKDSDAAGEQGNAAQAGPKHAAPVDTARVYSINDMEQLPEFPGGMKAMYAYIADSFQYTDTARSASAGGVIYVQFVVERTGEVDRVRLLRGVNDPLNDEAVRVISTMPDWTPGKYFGGTVVACRMVVPIRCQRK